MAMPGGYFRSIAPGIALAVSVALAACATKGEIKTSLAQLVGRPVKVAIARFGPPTGESSDDGKRSYFWVANYTASVVTPPPWRQNFGIIPPEGMSGFPVAGRDLPYNIRCWIRVDVGPDNRIIAYAWSGESAGCAALTRRLG